MLAFPKNDGLRLDYIFATGPLAARCTSTEIDRQERKGAKPSDHRRWLRCLTMADFTKREDHETRLVITGDIAESYIVGLP